ncbi:MAG: glycogen debranching protein GlgX [Phaeodactylibacter sp.]|nr:glycogen debranching protein GlgX [Phaeodactylibacter sp.]MCB9293555.1 glycogen debranching protein GlgX [Lewinellaceae bacterium]
MSKKPKARPGQSFPLGATVIDGGVNFCLFTKNASAVELLLFDAEDHRYPSYTFWLDPGQNKTFYYWHIFLTNIRPGQLYGWRVYGPYAADKGYRFDGNKVLIDPYARAVAMDTYDRQAAIGPGDNSARAIKSVVVADGDYDWEGDKPLNHPFSRSIIYEMHVGGFTRHPSSGLPEELRGTYRGLAEKIPYLKKLGITAVELLPVQQFDPFDVPNDLSNYWGYSPIAFFAPHQGYSSTPDPLGTIREFRDMVKALHRAGIEVILDVVFNHSGEGDEQGPTLSFRGIENRAYYMLNKENSHYAYQNFTGTGNTLNANHSVVRRMIRDCLRYWVSEMHVDGFRFDLASVLSRDENGRPIQNPPVLWEIESDPVLAPTKIIAEAWDVHQYQVGSFVGDKWAEWNGRYRDDTRRFVKGDAGMASAVRNRITASPDLFKKLLRDPNRSINFITCHDGFTLNDLVSYNEKHNFANGEGNRDGHNANFSWNCGAEGPSADPKVEKLRQKQIRNFFTLLMISQGTPMLLMGDEVRRTQQGNNNAYCQDNEISWFNWDLVEQNPGLLRFVQQLTRFNLSMEFFQEEWYWNTPEHLGGSSCTFHGIELSKPDFGFSSHSLAFSLKNRNYDKRLHAMINMYWEPLEFELPGSRQWKWKQAVNTAAPASRDIYSLEDAPAIRKRKVKVEARSVVVAVGVKGGA